MHCWHFIGYAGDCHLLLLLYTHTVSTITWDYAYYGLSEIGKDI